MNDSLEILLNLFLRMFVLSAFINFYYLGPDMFRIELEVFELTPFGQVPVLQCREMMRDLFSPISIPDILLFFLDVRISECMKGFIGFMCVFFGTAGLFAWFFCVNWMGYLLDALLN